jgi:hypothetical protein
MAYTITSGQVQPGVLYLVNGQQSVVYNGTTYASGTTFRGVTGTSSFTYTGTGTQSVTEVLELYAAAISFVENALDLPHFNVTTQLNSFGVEFVQNKGDMKTTDTTQINCFSVEVMDYPYLLTPIYRR